VSSRAFEVKLQADPIMRLAVLLAGATAGIAGVLLIVSFGLPWEWRVAATLIWLADCAWQLVRQVLGARQVTGFRLDSGGRLATICATGRERPARLLTGSLVLKNVAWFRVGLADGRSYGELLLAARTDPVSWHRLQLLWNQSREAFGQSVRA